MQIYFVRHGESEANAQKIISNRGLAHGLTERGRQQAQSLAESLRAIPVARIYTSPLLRAVETAAILARELAAPVEIADGLRENDLGILEGRSDEQSWAAVRKLAEDWILGRNRESCPAGGETFYDVRNRFVPFVRDLVDRYQDTDQCFVLVGHGGIYHILLPEVLSNVSYEFSAKHLLHNTGRVVAEPRGKELVCLEWAGVSLSEP